MIDRVSVAVLCAVVFRRYDQPSPFPRSAINSFDYINHLLLVIECPIDLTVVTGTQVHHNVLVSEEEHHRTTRTWCWSLEPRRYRPGRYNHSSWCPFSGYAPNLFTLEGKLLLPHMLRCLLSQGTCILLSITINLIHHQWHDTRIEEVNIKLWMSIVNTTITLSPSLL